ncbi:MAG: TerB family tellurite resistance protein [Myxococcales bacterium]|nr:TerB family tellurite resistance protein [Myxococcales bacterium]MCB9753659.1 TerB family tellurite resistance protein [Myxococcales bacterium]
MKFVCAFAWADLEIQDAEREFVGKLINALELHEDRDGILRWLERPPPPEEVDPTRVPRHHRDLVLDAARHVFEADGVIHPSERAQFELLEQLLC